MAKLNPKDREALERALSLAKADPAMTEMLEGRGWRDAAETAAAHYQHVNLRLRPWQTEPMFLVGATVDGVDEADAGGVALLRRMLAAGLSRYEPDPLAALAEAGKAGE